LSVAIVATKYLLFAIVCCSFLVQPANAQDCRSFGRDAQKAIKTHVAALQRLEHEASDRTRGRDTRPFEFLRDEAKNAVAVITEPGAIKREEELQKCRNQTFPIRKTCADAAEQLLAILEKYVANPTPDYNKPAYAAAMGSCEKWMDLKPLKSLIRGTE
jgi:hypothetical protein